MKNRLLNVNARNIPATGLICVKTSIEVIDSMILKVWRIISALTANLTFFVIKKKDSNNPAIGANSKNTDPAKSGRNNSGF